MQHVIDLIKRSIQLDRIPNNDKKWIYNIAGPILALCSFGLMGCIYQPLFIIYLLVYSFCLASTKFLEKIHLFIFLACLLCIGISGLILYRQAIILYTLIASAMSMCIFWLSQEELKEMERAESDLIENIKSDLQVQIDQSNILGKDKIHVEKEMQKLYVDLQEQTNYMNSLKELIHEQQYTINTLLHQKEEVLEQCRNLHKESHERQNIISKLENKLQSLGIEESNEVLIDSLNKLRLQYFQCKLMTSGLVRSNLDIEKMCTYMDNFIQLEEDLHYKLEDIHDLRLTQIYLESTIARMQRGQKQLLEENATLEAILAQCMQREEFYQSLDHENDFLEKNIKALLPKKKKKTIPVEVG